MTKYQEIDPSTIKFDFTNTKIRVNSPEESEWVQKAAFANGWNWLSYDTKILVTWCKKPYLFFKINTIGDGDNEIYFNKQKNVEITIQDILNQQQMEQVFEVGDVVEYVAETGFAGEMRIVEEVEGNKIWFNKAEGSWDRTKNLKIVSKAPKQEIIGYELLKDLPGVKKGVIYTPENHAKDYFNSNGNSFHQHLHLDTISNTDWFKPIYKAKDVVVKISDGRKVKITADKVDFDGVEFCTFNQLDNIYAAVNNRHIATGIKSYPFQITAFKIGCQEFTKEDIINVYNSIKSLN